MPVKILLADKSITIQKVVEMLFSGRDYEVVCASDGETALQEATRSAPDVVLADVDLPRLDGYRFAARLRQTPALAQTPVILMMSRDDVYDAAKGKQAGILDSIAKPFESQELIGKVKKALSSGPPRLSEPAPRPAAPSPAAPVIARPSKAAPSDILDIIQEAPTEAELKMTAEPAEEEAVYEVEPEVEEVMEPLAREIARALPVGEKAVEEMRVGLGLSKDAGDASSELVPFESFDTGAAAAPPKPVVERPSPAPAGEAFVRTAKETVVKAPPPAEPERGAPSKPASLSEEELWSVAERTMAAMAEKIFKDMPPPTLPKISDETVRRGIEEAVMKVAREIARDVIEQVAWEVIPPLAEQLIKEEIERLKAMES